MVTYLISMSVSLASEVGVTWWPSIARYGSRSKTCENLGSKPSLNHHFHLLLSTANLFWMNGRKCTQTRTRLQKPYRGFGRTLTKRTIPSGIRSTSTQKNSRCYSWQQILSQVSANHEADQILFLWQKVELQKGKVVRCLEGDGERILLLHPEANW